MSSVNLILNAPKFVRKAKKAEESTTTTHEINNEPKTQLKMDAKVFVPKNRKTVISTKTEVPFTRTTTVENQTINIPKPQKKINDDTIEDVDEKILNTEKTPARSSSAFVPEGILTSSPIPKRLPTKQEEKYVPPSPKVKYICYTLQEIENLRSKAIHLTESDVSRFNKMASENKKKKPIVPKNLFTTQLNNDELVQSKILAILNKLSEERIVPSVLAVESLLKTSNELSIFLDMLFKKSINEPKFASLYVEFFIQVKRNPKIYDKFVQGENILMKTLLDKSCQLFHAIPQPKPRKEGITPEEEIQLKNTEEIEKIEYFGTVRLIGKLYIQGAVVFKLPLLCCKELLQVGNDLTIEALTILLKDVWKNLKDENEEELQKILDQMRLTENNHNLAKRTHIIVQLCLDDIEANWVSSFVERSVSTPVKGNIYCKYAPKKTNPVKPTPTRGAHRIEREKKEYDSSTPTQMRTPIPQTPTYTAGVFGEQIISKFIKNEIQIEEIMKEIENSNAYGECVKKLVSMYETCNEKQLIKIKELITQICCADCEALLKDALINIKEDNEGLEGGASDVMASLFSQMLINNKYQWEELGGFLDEKFEDVIMKKAGVKSTLYVLSQIVLEIIRKKGVNEISTILKDKEELFEEVMCCGSFGASLFSAWMKTSSGSNLSIREENEERIIPELKEVIPLLKTLGEGQQGEFKKMIEKLWIDPNEITLKKLEEIKILLTENNLL
ncbi:hypothetical protein KM1_224740 [Entamoeba histolytica HM-3:IMSS]|uniref:Uncharacterized protein n=1 Tax=Entamoeba histolytica HM-3:IMSS TaxID=885315 RepID=M7X814_ENTHI|nr:hypothetical protein KM1_224740 [Entamoeba histolytica HM-3:IMSS]